MAAKYFQLIPLFLSAPLLVVSCSEAETPGPGPTGTGGVTGGTSGTTGGQVNSATGGAVTGGTNTGGLATGGVTTGGSVSGGSASGGSVSGGSVSGGTGGASSSGGSTTGGNAVTGGVGNGGAGKGGAGGQATTGGAGGKAGGTGGQSSGGAGKGGAGGQATTGGQATGGGGAGGGGSTMLAATPPMGWNSWNTFGCNNLTEALIKGVADTFVSSGMKDVGYQYVNLDDCWMNGRDGSGKIQVNATKFPSGMAALAKYIHDKGLKMGLYSTPGTQTCAAIYGGYSGGVGSLGHEQSDAQTYASWGVDYLKYDKCTAALSGFAPMRDALRASGRQIFYSINPGDGTGCIPGKCGIDLPTTANMWRIGFDINASWSSVVSLIDQNAPLSQYAGPGHWNDPDMLEVGKLANETEDRAHFSMWAIMAAPLLAGNDIRSMSATTKAILTNAEVIAVDQDPLGVQGKVVASPGTNLQVWAKKLSGTNTVAVALFNRGTSAASITAQWTAIGLPAGAATVRDLWSHMDLGSSMNSYTASSVPGHGVVMLKITSTP
ncbi:MAG TPA: glycoside hydrolase family 27 protein [Polyangiaceae bacterium]|nr:glycoside hydrolase family 27 protein [Polyangiaceae bacterium]